ncbi:MAG: HlyD family secretion protein [Mangrovibacterium sp.]
MNKTRNFIIGIFFSALLIFLLYTTWLITRPVPLKIQGEIDATQIRVSSKVPGRIDEIAVKKGQRVQKGDFLFSISSPETEAKMQQATAAREAAEAQNLKARHGAREEDIKAAYSTYLKAEAAARLYEKTYQRIANLFEAGVLPEQKKDEAETRMKTSRETANAAQAVWNKARKGVRAEDKKTSEELVRQAEGAIAEVEAYLRETRITAPANGEVANVVPEEGELVGSGSPVISLLDLSETWAVLYLREDLMPMIRMDTEFKADIPALGLKDARFKIDYISPAADFATWTSTKTSGGFDVKSFEIHATPVKPLEGLRPGMSVLVNWKQFKN